MLSNAPRPQHRERHEHLLRVARHVFAEKGFQSTTMDDVARDAGFTKPIVYQYFDSKIDLYRQIVTETAQRLLTQLECAVSKVDVPRTKLEVAFRVYFDMVVGETDAFRILFIHHHEGETASELRNLELGLVTFVAPYINLEISPEHRQQLAAGVVGIAEGIAIAWLVQQQAQGWPTPADNEAERLAARSATLAWGGMRAAQHD